MTWRPHAEFTGKHRLTDRMLHNAAWHTIHPPHTESYLGIYPLAIDARSGRADKPSS